MARCLPVCIFEQSRKIERVFLSSGEPKKTELNMNSLSAVGFSKNDRAQNTVFAVARDPTTSSDPVTRSPHNAGTSVGVPKANLVTPCACEFFRGCLVVDVRNASATSLDPTETPRTPRCESSGRLKEVRPGHRQAFGNKNASRRETTVAISSRPAIGTKTISCGSVRRSTTSCSARGVHSRPPTAGARNYGPTRAGDFFCRKIRLRGPPARTNNDTC